MAAFAFSALPILYRVIIVHCVLLLFVLLYSRKIHLDSNYRPSLLAAIMVGILALVLSSAWHIADFVGPLAADVVYVVCFAFVFLHTKREHDRIVWGDVDTARRWKRVGHSSWVLALGSCYIFFPGSLLIAFLAPSNPAALPRDASGCAYTLRKDIDGKKLIGPYNHVLWSDQRPGEAASSDSSSPVDDTISSEVSCEDASFNPFGLTFISVPSYLHWVVLDNSDDQVINLLFPLRVLYIWAPLALALGVTGKGLTDRLLEMRE